jgi:hypothetical protein
VGEDDGPERDRRSGARVRSGAGNNTLRLWDLDSGTQLASFISDGAISAMAVAENGPRVILGHSGGRVIVLNVLS